MSTITILHLSDIHFKRNKDDENKTYRNDVKNKMRAKIKEHINNTNMALDFVAVTGDIAFSGTEYEEAKKFFDELKSVVPEKNAFSSSREITMWIGIRHRNFSLFTILLRISKLMLSLKMKRK